MMFDAEETSSDSCEEVRYQIRRTSHSIDHSNDQSSSDDDKDDDFDQLLEDSCDSSSNDSSHAGSDVGTPSDDELANDGVKWVKGELDVKIPDFSGGSLSYTAEYQGQTNELM